MHDLDTTETNGTSMRTSRQTITPPAFAERKTSDAGWAARVCALIALAIFAVAFWMAGELHKARLDIEATKDRIDVLIEHIDGLVPRQSQHALCVGKKVEMGLPRPGATDMGVPFACPNPDDGACLPGPDGKPQLAQLAEAHCAAGKL